MVGSLSSFAVVALVGFLVALKLMVRNVCRKAERSPQEAL
jgi:hypothetical protein